MGDVNASADADSTIQTTDKIMHKRTELSVGATGSDKTIGQTADIVKSDNLST
jgi:hypothetical protein